MTPRSHLQRFGISIGVWLGLMAVIAIINTIIYATKQAPGLGVGVWFSIFGSSFANMLKFFLVLPAMWMVSIWHRITGVNGIFHGAELGMTAYLLLTPYIAIPVMMRWLRNKKTA